jgi:predicted permease
VHPEGDRAVVPAGLAVVGFGLVVLIVASANLAGVMLARGLARRRELAIRLALGAGRGRIVAGLVLEGALLAGAGGALGLAIARAAVTALAAWRPDLPVPVSLSTAIDWRVAAFTLAITGVATIAFAVLPALRVSRTPAAGSMTVAGISRRRVLSLRDALLVPQLAIALALVAVAALFARSLAGASAIDPGFDTGRTAFVSLNLAMSGYDDERAAQFYERLTGELVRQRAIDSAAVADRMPLDFYGNRSMTVWFGEAFSRTRSLQAAGVSPGYFETLGIPILQGRAFTEADRHADVAIVSAAAARVLWPGAPALGQSVRTGDERVVVVIGIAADARVQTLGEAPEPLIYRPLAGGHSRLLRLIVRAGGDPRAAVDAMRLGVRALDPGVGIFEARAVTDYIDVMLYPYRLAAAIGACLGLFTLGLAAVGLYGVLACGVSERLRELAIRIALGGGPSVVVRAAMRGPLRAAAAGLAAGGVLTIVAGRLLSTVLFGISPFDPAALVTAAGILFLVLAAAAAAPVRRALRLAPMAVLRQ